MRKKTETMLKVTIFMANEQLIDLSWKEQMKTWNSIISHNAVCSRVMKFKPVEPNKEIVITKSTSVKTLFAPRYVVF